MIPTRRLRSPTAVVDRRQRCATRVGSGSPWTRSAVAFDVGPLHGHRTGVGAAVAELRRRSRRATTSTCVPYLLSFRDGAASRRRGGCRCPPRVAHRLWARLDRPAVDRWLRRRRGRPRHELRRRRRAGPALVSVYDCWFLANPGAAAPASPRRRRPAAAACRRAPRCTRRARRPPRLLAELLGTDRVEVVHLGPPGASGAAPARRAGAGRRHSPGARSCSPSARSSGARTCRRSSPRSAAADADGDRALVIAGAAGDDAGPSTAADRPPCRAGVRSRVIRSVRSATTPRPGCCTHASVARLPVARRGLRVPAARGPAVGLPVVATRAGSIPEVGGDGRRARRPSATATPSPRRSRTFVDDGVRRAELIDGGRSNVARFSWARHGRGDRRRSTGDCRGASGDDALDVAVVCRRGRRGPVPARPAAGRRCRPRSPPSSTPATTPCSTGCRSPPTSTRSSTRWPAPSTPSAAGGWAARRGRRWRPSPGTTAVRPPGSAAAPTWFNLGDRDLATHLYRTARLRRGRRARRPSPARSPRRGASASRMLPMTDDRLATMVELADRRGGRVPGLLRAPPPRRAGAARCASPATAAPDRRRARRRWRRRRPS